MNGKYMNIQQNSKSINSTHSVMQQRSNDNNTTNTNDKMYQSITKENGFRMNPDSSQVSIT